MNKIGKKSIVKLIYKMAISKNLKFCIKHFLNISNQSERDSIYLETGLDKGDSIFFICNNFNFKKNISIEIDQLKIDKVQNNLLFKKFYDRITIILGNSSEIINKIYNQNIKIFFLDAHGFYNNFDKEKIFPLEKELKFLIDQVNENQLIIIDDFIKIKNFNLFTNKLDWRNKLKYEDFKKMFPDNNFRTKEIFYENGLNSYLLITKNKNFKFKISSNFLLFFTNSIQMFLSIRFYLKHYMYYIYYKLKKILKLIND